MSRPVLQPVPELKAFTVAAVVVAEVEATDERDAQKIVADAVHRELVMRGQYVREGDGNLHLRLPDVPSWDDVVQFSVKVYTVLPLFQAIADGWVTVAAKIRRKVYRTVQGGKVDGS